MSFDAPTTFSALPTSLTGTYNGELIGRYKAVVGDDAGGRWARPSNLRQGVCFCPF